MDSVLEFDIGLRYFLDDGYLFIEVCGFIADVPFIRVESFDLSDHFDFFNGLLDISLYIHVFLDLFGHFLHTWDLNSDLYFLNGLNLDWNFLNYRCSSG